MRVGTYVRMADRKERIARLLDEGFSGLEIARRLGISHSTVSRIAARMGRQLGAARGSDFDWRAIHSYYDAGHSVAECCRHFGISRGAWDRALTRGDVAPRPKNAPPPSETRKAVERLLAEGRSQTAIAQELELSKATIAHHVRRLGIPADDRFSRRYDWHEVQRAHDTGLSAFDCCKRFGFAKATWSKAVATGRVKPRDRKIPLEELLVVGRKTSRSHLKRRLLKAGMKENRCEICGITCWMGKPVNMQLHHKNGDGADNRLENIQFLCGNCHSQTDTYGGRNGHRKPDRHLELVEPLENEEEVA
jgi:DNA-binding CsgD family transcriptional regulator/5-methylcytosine-specific restriction endonuclease McrA